MLKQREKGDNLNNNVKAAINRTNNLIKGGKGDN